MKTSISSEALSQLGAKEIAFPSKKTYGQKDISNYRVALLLKTREAANKGINTCTQKFIKYGQFQSSSSEMNYYLL